MKTIYAAVLVHDEADDYEAFFASKDLAEYYVSQRKLMDSWARGHLQVEEIRVVEDGEEIRHCPR